jgi:hypothetical protein
MSEMKPSWLLPLLQLLGVPLAAGAVSAYLTNRLSAHYTFDRFRKEQWWQLKREAYESIIRILTDIMLTAERYTAREETGGTVVPRKPMPREKPPSWSLQEIVVAGSYIVSEKTVQAVRPVLDRLVDNENEEYVTEESPYELAVNDYSAAKAALTIVKAEALSDLGVK